MHWNFFFTMAAMTLLSAVLQLESGECQAPPRRAPHRRAHAPPAARVAAHAHKAS